MPRRDSACPDEEERSFPTSLTLALVRLRGAFWRVTLAACATGRASRSDPGASDIRAESAGIMRQARSARCTARMLRAVAQFGAVWRRAAAAPGAGQAWRR